MEVLNKFILGEGSYSKVYKVKRKSDGEIYALKKVGLLRDYCLNHFFIYLK